jgi:hypothetical protein
MWLSNKRPRTLNYSVNKKSSKTWKKIVSAIMHYKSLLKRETFEGETRWLQNAKKFVLAKFKKYWINPNKI